MSLRDFMPPLISRAIRRRRCSSRVYASYEQASRACAERYEQSDLCDVVFRKTVAYRDSLCQRETVEVDASGMRIALGIGLAARGGRLHVIDFGGACGVHYFFVRTLFAQRLDVRWFVVETPEMAARGDALADGEPRFFDDLDRASREIGPVDLVLSSGVLQYVPDPCATLGRLLACRAPSVLLTRVGLTTGDRDLVGVQVTRFAQNGPGPLPAGARDGVARYPVTAVREDRFEAMLKERYRIRVQFNEDRDAYVLGRYPIDMFGYFAELRDDPRAAG